MLSQGKRSETRHNVKCLRNLIPVCKCIARLGEVGLTHGTAGEYGDHVHRAVRELVSFEEDVGAAGAAHNTRQPQSNCQIVKCLS